MSRHTRASSLCREGSRVSLSSHVSRVSHTSHVTRSSYASTSSRRSASPTSFPSRSKYNLRSSTEPDKPKSGITTSALAIHNAHYAGTHAPISGSVLTEIDESDSETIKPDEKPKRRSSQYDIRGGAPSRSPTSTMNRAKSRPLAKTPTITNIQTRQLLESLQEEEDEAEQKNNLKLKRISHRDAMLQRAAPTTQYNKARSLFRISSESTICGDDSESDFGDSLGDDIGYGDLKRDHSLHAF